MPNETYKYRNIVYILVDSSIAVVLCLCVLACTCIWTLCKFCTLFHRDCAPVIASTEHGQHMHNYSLADGWTSLHIVYIHIYIRKLGIPNTNDSELPALLRYIYMHTSNISIISLCVHGWRWFMGDVVQGSRDTSAISNSSIDLPSLRHGQRKYSRSLTWSVRPNNLVMTMSFSESWSKIVTYTSCVDSSSYIYFFCILLFLLPEKR